MSILIRRRLLPGFLLFCVVSAAYAAADAPAGFFISDLSQNPPAPAFYNESTGKVEPLVLRGRYLDFIDVLWDQEHSRIFFSAHEGAGQPFRIYLKEGFAGEEKVIYVSPVGPFRFILSPDGDRLALQIMGPSAWPILAVYDWHSQHTVDLGQGYSPDWSPDGLRLLYLRIPDALPARLWEYQVQADTTIPVVNEPVIEAVYAQDSNHLILKTVARAKDCDMFELLDRRTRKRTLFSAQTLEGGGSKKCLSQREIGSFPGHQLFVFKESPDATEIAEEMLVVTDSGGGRLLEMAKNQWEPGAVVMDASTLVVGDEPLYILHADGAGGKQEIPHTAFIRPRT